MTMRNFILAVLLAAACLAAPGRAHANAGEVIEKICAQASEVCGDAVASKGIIDACFKGGADLPCAIAISDVATSGAVGQSKQYVDLIVACVNSALPLEGECKSILEQANVPAGEINQTYDIVNQCLHVGDVDGAILCADAVLGSEALKETGAQIPSWVNSLFGIYEAVRDKNFPKLIYEVGITVACAVANFFSGVDVCGVVEAIAKIGGEIVDGLEDVADFFNDVGSALGLGDNCPDPIGQDALFAQLWIPVVHEAAKNLSDPNSWNAIAGGAWNACMDRCGGTGDKGNGQAVCDMMRGVFGGAANRQASILELPKLIQERSKAIAATRYNYLTSTDAQRQWAAAEIAGVMGYTPAVAKALLADPTAWPAKSTGLVAFTSLSSPKLFPAGDPDSVSAHALAVKALADAEVTSNLQGQIDAFYKKQAENSAKAPIAHVDTSDGSAQKLLAACSLPSQPAVQKQCEGIVATRDAACLKKGADFVAAHPEVKDPDSTLGRTEKAQLQGVLEACRADIQKWAAQFVSDHTAVTAGPAASKATAPVPPVSWGGAPSPGNQPRVVPPSHTGHEALEKQGCTWVAANAGFACKTAAARDACVAARRSDASIKACELSAAAPISWGR